jgi:hypothetical protein
MAPAVPKGPAPGDVEVTLAVDGGSLPVDGRLLVLFTTDGKQEPRFQVSDGDETAQVFGLDVEGWAPGGVQTLVSPGVQGYPLETPLQLPVGDYVVQAVLHRYETFHRADGKVLKLPMDRGEGLHWNLAPGNLVSELVRVHWDPAHPALIALSLTHTLPPVPQLKETAYLKHVQIQSERLTKFWGRPMFLAAKVLLPEGFERHPEARYPVILVHSHFSTELSGWREKEVDPALPPTDRAALAVDCPNGHGERCAADGYERMTQEQGHRFFKQWTGPAFPRVLLVDVEQPNPFYDDAYGVNSANVGPFGDAIVYELLPFLEQRFRGLGPWARGLYGGSTGGWEALAEQIFYPDAFNGAIANCPDPIDFRAYMAVDLYADDNAYHSDGAFRRTMRPSSRDAFGHTRSMMSADGRLEWALGTHGRSGEQLDIWQAVFSPVGEDGYPKAIFDQKTGSIDRTVADYWREHYDLSHILEQEWHTLGPKLNGKLHINVGNLDTYFLDGAVRLTQRRLAGLKDPSPDIAFAYGDHDGHCWSGDPLHANFESRLTYHERFIPMLVQHFLTTAPKGADVLSWRY